MHYRVSQNHVLGLTGAPDTYAAQKITIQKNDVTFWGSRCVDRSGFSSMVDFSTTETYWNANYLQDLTAGFDPSKETKPRYYLSLV